MNRCGAYNSLTPHLDALLWCRYVCSQARSSQRRRFRVALLKLLIVWKSFLELFARLQTIDINGMSPNPITWRWKFFLLAEKKEQIFCSRMWACIFRVKWCTVGIHNAMARIVLETNSSGDVFCLWFRISLSADENMKTNSGNKCISEKWKTYAFFVFQSHCCEKELSKSLR